MNRASDVCFGVVNAYKHHYAEPHFIFSKLVSMSRPSLFILYLCDLYFIFSLIFIVINHIASLKQTDALFFVYFLQYLYHFLEYF